MQAVRDFYGLGPDVLLESHLVTRSTTDVDRPKRLYYINPGGLHPRCFQRTGTVILCTAKSPFIMTWVVVIELSSLALLTGRKERGKPYW